MVDAPLVFVTSYSDPTIIERAKRISPAGFIVKPFNTNDIHAIVEIVLYNKRTKPAPEVAAVKTGTESPFLVTDAVFIKADNAFERVPYEEVYYVEANGNMVTIFTKNRDYHIRKSMKEIEEILPSHLFPSAEVLYRTTRTDRKLQYQRYQPKIGSCGASRKTILQQFLSQIEYYYRKLSLLSTNLNLDPASKEAGFFIDQLRLVVARIDVLKSNLA